MGLWVAFNPDTFRSEESSFERSTSVIHRHYKNLMRAMFDVGHRYIRWPSALERRRTALYYERTFGIPGTTNKAHWSMDHLFASSVGSMCICNVAPVLQGLCCLLMELW